MNAFKTAAELRELEFDDLYSYATDTILQLTEEKERLESVIRGENANMLACLMHMKQHGIEFGSTELIARLDEIDQLKAQLETESELRKCAERDYQDLIKWLNGEQSYPVGAHVKAAAEKFRQQLDDLKRDKERLDWLLENLYVMQTDAGCHDKSRQAIDSAMKKGNE